MKKEIIIEYDKTKESGNIFFILAMVREELIKNRRIDEFNNLRDKVYASKSYEEALQNISKVVTLKEKSC